ncbi:MAG: response regulator [Lachnospirales bacterium]
MKKIVIIDDEFRQCNGLKKIISNMYKNIDPIAFLDIDEGIQYIKENNIKILISDICMPNMSGLELTKLLKEHNKYIKVIFLTGYADFEYAQEAVKLGASEYLLKPVNPIKLKIALDNVIKSLWDEEILTNKYKIIEKKLSVTLPVYIENIMNQWINGRATEETICEIKTIIPTGSTILLLSKFDSLDKISEIYSKEKLNDVKNMILYYTRKLIRYTSFSFFSQTELNLLITIVVFKEYKNIFFVTDKIYDYFINNFSKDDKEVDFKIIKKITTTVSKATDFIYKDIPTMYTLAYSASKYSFYYHLDSIIYEESINFINVNKPSISLSDEAILKESILSGNKVKSKEILNAFFNRHEFLVEPEYLINLFESLIIRVCRVYEMDFSNKFIFAHDYFINFKESCFQFIELIIDEINLKQNFKNKYFSSNVIRYIEENHAHDITLDEISNQFNFTPAYFSKIIKEATGKNFSTILLEVRIDKAKEILKVQNNKVYEVAKLVGYNDVKYFNRVFKRTTGMTPAMYKRTIRCIDAECKEKPNKKI